MVWYPIGVTKLADAAMHVVNTYALASFAVISIAFAISSAMGAIITIVALFESTSVRNAVHKYNTIKRANGCHCGSKKPKPMSPTSEAICFDAPVVCIVIPRASIP